jgi:hypothetical protein
MKCLEIFKVQSNIERNISTIVSWQKKEKEFQLYDFLAATVVKCQMSFAIEVTVYLETSASDRDHQMQTSKIMELTQRKYYFHWLIVR